MEIVKIDLVPSGVMPSCHASQYDIGREIRFLLTDGGEEYTLAGTETISIELRKPDGTSETIAIPNTSSNYVDWETSDGELNLSGVYLAEISIKNGDDVLGSANFIVKTEADAYDGAGVRTVTVGPADICTFETTLAEPLQSVLVNVEATGGNGTADNPNPINGYTEANITRCGVNLWDGTKQDNVGVNATTGNLYASTGTFTTDYIKVAPNTACYANPTNWKTWACFYDASKTYVNYTSIVNGVINTTAEAVYMRISGDMNELSTACINYPATDTTYHPYNGNTYTISFGQTVYFGQLIILRGRTYFHGTHGGVDLSTLTWSVTSLTSEIQAYATGDLSTLAKLPVNNSTPLNAICSTRSVVSVNAIYSNNNAIAMNNGGTTFSRVDGASTPPTGTLAYELDTPFDIDLTPEVILAVVGENNVFADCGQTTVKYLKAGA